MMETFKIAVPQPCHESWEAMIPEKDGRFCDRCTKTVVDFTHMLPQEVQQYFVKNKGQKICGRFNSAQLDRREIEIPEHILYRKRPFRKAFLLALFVVMGSSLFSCRDQRTMGDVTVVKDSVAPKAVAPPPHQRASIGVVVVRPDSIADQKTKEPKQQKP